MKSKRCKVLGVPEENCSSGSQSQGVINEEDNRVSLERSQGSQGSQGSQDS